MKLLVRLSKALAYCKLLEWRIKELNAEIERLQVKYELTDKVTLPDNIPVSNYKVGMPVTRPSGHYQITGVDPKTNSLMLEKISKENLYSSDR